MWHRAQLYQVAIHSGKFKGQNEEGIQFSIDRKFLNLLHFQLHFIIFFHEIIPHSECLMSPGPRAHELIPPYPWHHYFSHAVNDIHNVQGIHCLCLHQSFWHLYSYLLTIITFIECSQYLKISTLSNCLHSILKVRKISYFWELFIFLHNLHTKYLMHKTLNKSWSWIHIFTHNIS